MKYNLDKGHHGVSSLQYHLIMVVKYRRSIFENDEIIDLLKQKVMEISSTFNVNLLNQECDKDHIHILFRSSPTLDIPRYINAMKTISSREIRRNFPEVKTKLWKDALWARSYFIATTGEVTLDVLYNYVNSQGNTNATNDED